MTKQKSQAELEIEALALQWRISPSLIKKEGNNLTIGGSLDLSGCTSLTSLPDNLTIGGSLDLSGCTKIKKPKTINRPAPNFLGTLRASIECRFNLRGFTIADGILARIISSCGKTKKIRIVGKKEISYLVNDDDGNYSHGKTIKQARADLVYKAVAKFDGNLPEKATGKEWVGIYRAVTGACGAGVKMFVDNTGKNLDETYTAKQVAEIAKGQFGADKFEAKIREAK